MNEATQPTSPSAAKFDPRQVTRPHSRLLTYYTLCSLLTGPLAPILFVPAFLKYKTLQYRFDDSGVGMSWGILFRRETYLTYQRIQDIHLTRNIVQRWLGLATVSVQTASASSTPEMSIDGILEANALRDFLYAKMRGAKGESADRAATPNDGSGDETLQILHDIRDSLQQLARQRGVA